MTTENFDEYAAIVHSKDGDPPAKATIRVETDGRTALVVFRGDAIYKRVDNIKTVDMSEFTDSLIDSVGPDWTPNERWTRVE